VPKPASAPLTHAALLVLRHEKIHARFVDLHQHRQRTRPDALRIMEKEFFLTARALYRLLNTPLPVAFVPVAPSSSLRRPSTP
jgi:hypothetical protein